MLRDLHVKNLALIRETEVSFDKGLNILTGETGAGKSLLLGAVSLALGERIPKELLRSDTEALIELTFETDPELDQKLKELEIEPEDGTIILSRRISEKKSIARINGETVPLSKMREASSLLISIHGQMEHQILKKKSTHLDFLDRFGGAAVAEAKEAYEEVYRAFREKEKEYGNTDLSEEQQKRELDLLTYEVREIEEADLKEGEDKEVEEEFLRLSNASKIREALGAAKEYVTQGETSASWQVNRALGELSKAVAYDPALQELCDELNNIDALINDFQRDMGMYGEDGEGDEEKLFRLTERLDLINRLKQKYAPEISDILKALEEKRERADFLQSLAERKEALFSELSELKEQRQAAADRLSAERGACRARFDEAMTEALSDLNFLDVRFTTEMEKLPEPGPNGQDDVQFLIALNPGEPELPVQKVASGGELSRIMLALSAVVTGPLEVGSVIFDEIDAGISGRTAQAVSEKLSAISRGTQILCITHLPQIAAMADQHFLIEKDAEEGLAVSRIRELSEEEIVEELSRMLGGVSVTDAAKQNAIEMRTQAKNKKEIIGS